MATIEIKLSQPVEIDGVMLEAILIQPITPADLAAVNRLNARTEVRAMKLIGRLTGLDRANFAHVCLFNPGVMAKVSDIVARQVSAVRHG